MSLKPLFWPKKVGDFNAGHRLFWYAYWGQDLLALRASYPELADWDDRGLICAITDFYHAIHGLGDIETSREVRFLDWLRLSVEFGRRLDRDAFQEIEGSAYDFRHDCSA